VTPVADTNEEALQAQRCRRPAQPLLHSVHAEAVYLAVAPHFMETLCLVLLAIGGLLIFVGNIVGVVAAFRVNVWWGLAVLIVPFAALAFLLVHWRVAWKGFAIMLVGLVAIGGSFLVKPALLAGARGIAGKPAPARPSTAPGGSKPATAAAAGAGVKPELSASLKREEAAAAEQELRVVQRLEKEKAYTKHRAEADAMFKDLSDRRAKLKPGDKAATAAFNQDAARYQTLLAQAKAEKTELDAMSPTPAPAVNNPGATATASAKPAGAAR
jgi:hypothetical protein